MIGRFLTFIRFSHTVFALPFALGSMLVASGGWPSVRLISLIILAMAFARTAAMLFNRVVDWEIDKRNPRTVGRHKLISKKAAIVWLVLTSVGFMSISWFINLLCFVLSPVALVIVFFYSLTKRFTSLSHFFLGLALAVSPVGAWLAVRGEIAFAPLVLAAAVLPWVAGFDIIYATQDHEFDKAHGLKSMVVGLGIPRSLRLAQRLHWLALAGLIIFGLFARLGPYYALSIAVIAAALFYEHRMARRADLESINKAFFLSNAVVGLVFLLGIWAEQFLA